MSWLCQAWRRSHQSRVGRGKGQWAAVVIQYARLASMQGQDPYAMLGVSRETALKGVKQAYLELARQHHPDSAGGGNEEVFKKLSAAMQAVLVEHKHMEPACSQRVRHQEYDPSFVFDFVKDSVDSAKLQQELKEVHEHMGAGGPDMGGWFFMASMMAKQERKQERRSKTSQDLKS